MIAHALQIAHLPVTEHNLLMLLFCPIYQQESNIAISKVQKALNVKLIVINLNHVDS